MIDLYNVQTNQLLGSIQSDDATTANLLDQRDNYVNQLAQLMDINVVNGDHNQITVFTNSGIQLVGNVASTLSLKWAYPVVTAGSGSWSTRSAAT